MVSINTHYLGLPLSSPIVVSSNPLCRDVGQIIAMQAAGAGAVILPTFFAGSDTVSERQFDDYARLIKDATNAVDLPIIASLNAKSAEIWQRYASRLSALPISALELNIYHLPTDVSADSRTVEAAYIETTQRVVANATVPVAIKLHPYFSALGHVTTQLVEAGARGLVLFNRFYEPNFDLAQRKLIPALHLSDSMDLSLRLRWMSLLYGQVDADWGISGGIHSGEDVVKALLAGADVAMVASILLHKGVDYLNQLRADLTAWMEGEGYFTVEEVQGRVTSHFSDSMMSLHQANYDIGTLSVLPPSH